MFRESGPGLRAVRVCGKSFWHISQSLWGQIDVESIHVLEPDNTGGRACRCVTWWPSDAACGYSPHISSANLVLGWGAEWILASRRSIPASRNV